MVHSLFKTRYISYSGFLQFLCENGLASFPTSLGILISAILFYKLKTRKGLVSNCKMMSFQIFLEKVHKYP